MQWVDAGGLTVQIRVFWLATDAEPRKHFASKSSEPDLRDETDLELTVAGVATIPWTFVARWKHDNLATDAGIIRVPDVGVKVAQRRKNVSIKAADFVKPMLDSVTSERTMVPQAANDSECPKPTHVHEVAIAKQRYLHTVSGSLCRYALMYPSARSTAAAHARL